MGMIIKNEKNAKLNIHIAEKKYLNIKFTW